MKNLVLLPGVGCDEEFWAYQIKHLDDIVNSQVIVLDQQDSLEEMIEHVLSVTPKTFSLAGHSSGGWLAQALAARAPERIENLFLLGTFAENPPEFWEGMAEWVKRMKNGECEQILDNEIVPLVFHEKHLSDKDLIDRHQRMKKRMSAQAYVRQMQALLDHRSTLEFLPHIKAPTLIISGREDIPCALAGHELILKHIPDAQLAIIEECGHMMCMEQPQAVTALMRLWFTLHWG